MGSFPQTPLQSDARERFLARCRRAFRRSPSPQGSAGESYCDRTRFFAAWTGFDVLRLVMAIILFTAAGLKGYQLATEPVGTVPIFAGTVVEQWSVKMGLSPLAGLDRALQSRWFLIGVVEFELFFALWLVSALLPSPAGRGTEGEGLTGISGSPATASPQTSPLKPHAFSEPFLTWFASIVLFSTFTCISLYMALSGHATCGCFGPVRVSPWYTSTVDFALALSLLVWRPKGLSLEVLHFSSCNLAKRAAFLLVAWALVGLPAAYAMRVYSNTMLSDVGNIIGDGKVVWLTPEKWKAGRFPLLNYIDIGDKLSDGLWLVLLHRHTCSACREAALKYESLAKEFSEAPNCPRIALIDCLPCEPREVSDDAVTRGQLDPTYRWELPGPICLLIDNGDVRSVFANAGDVALLKTIWAKE